MQDGEAPVDQLWPTPAPTVAATDGVKQGLEDRTAVSPSPSLRQNNNNSNKKRETAPLSPYPNHTEPTNMD